jgi:hypothetical protein
MPEKTLKDDLEEMDSRLERLEEHFLNIFESSNTSTMTWRDKIQYAAMILRERREYAKLAHSDEIGTPSLTIGADLLMRLFKRKPESIDADWSEDGDTSSTNIPELAETGS